jgi:hypothetical protein
MRVSIKVSRSAISADRRVCLRLGLDRESILGD